MYVHHSPIHYTCATWSASNSRLTHTHSLTLTHTHSHSLTLTHSHSHTHTHSHSQMCEVLGIVEMDYFGLKFSDRTAGCDAWVNNRTNLKNQLKLCKRPYRLGFRVKFFTDPHLLQQPSTKSVSTSLLLFLCQSPSLQCYLLPNNNQPKTNGLTHEN